MAEELLNLHGVPKEEAYLQLLAQSEAVLTGVTDTIVGMATISCLLYHGFGLLWAGFYRVAIADALLRVGPYQGSLGCLEIRFGAGVCGTAAAERRTIVVPDVTRFPGHIACDARSRSEIVVPVFGRDGRLLAVMDLDSERPAAFDAVDAHWLERIVQWFGRLEALT